MPRLTFKDYQLKATTTSLMPYHTVNREVVTDVSGLWYSTCGLCNEAGEVAGKVKKIARDDKGLVTPDKKSAIAHELGDVLWYLSDLAFRIGYDLGEIAEMNLEKLQDRLERGKLGGSGDER